MVLYFSGTGNSEYVAKRIAKGLGDEALNLFERIVNNDNSMINSSAPFVVVAPTYAWELPHIVEKYLLNTPLKVSKDIYFVLTCGSSIGGAGYFAKKLSKTVSMEYRGIAQVKMPENYIAMFSAPNKEESIEIINKSEGKIDNIIAAIKAGNRLTDGSGPFGILFTRAMNYWFYKFCVTDKKFYVKDKCNGCGLCTKMCPNGNIELSGGKPVWKGDCTHCMACICHCPQEAVEYGKKSVGQPRYKCPKKCE